MQFRMPCTPLITVDPYFSIWSEDKLNEKMPIHWTGSPNSMLGILKVDGEEFCFLGKPADPKRKLSKIPQIRAEFDACTTTVVFANESVELTALFTTPMLADDLYYASRPVLYLKLKVRNLDGKEHRVSAKISCSEELVLNKKGEGRAWSEPTQIPGSVGCRMGSGAQKILWRSGDDVRIDWGYFYLTAKDGTTCGNEVFDDLYAVYAEAPVEPEALFLFAYDDIDSLIYFEKPVKAYWKKGGKTIEEAIAEAMAQYDDLKERCDALSEKIRKDAAQKGGTEYAQLLLLAYRQAMAAQKLAVDENGELIYVSKECFSNGCAATVDITYPSAPMYLYLNPELLKAMIRPVMRFAESSAWEYDFAPHDVGQYPILNGQVYGADGTKQQLKYQMPVEESGNLMILFAAICEVQNSVEFAKPYLETLAKWNEYLVTYGADPEDQLCTDDFAGRLAHNCNLALKAIMGMVGYAKILSRFGREKEARELMEKAKEYADSWCVRAANEDGSYRLTFDRPGTFSLKYNLIWDKIWKTQLFPQKVYEGEVKRYLEEALPYGVPLDSREKYTKSDWLVWAAYLAPDRKGFETLVGLLWKAYSTMRTRVPMTDWYYADTSEMRGFRHRSVIGGLYIALLS